MIALDRSQILACRSHLVRGWRILFLQCLLEEDRQARRENRCINRVREIDKGKTENQKKRRETQGAKHTSREYSRTKRFDEGIPIVQGSALVRHKIEEVDISWQLHL
jgi:hypothetical protein